MSGQEDFLKKIHELEDLAKEEGSLSMEEIRKALDDQEISEEQMEFVCRYFESRQIRIRGRGSEDAEPEIHKEDRNVRTGKSRSDERIVQIYLEELARSGHMEAGREQELISRMLEGDDEARNRLVEANLSLAVEVAREFEGKGLPVSDLIQEGNLGLITAVSLYRPETHGSFRDHLAESVRSHVEDRLSDYNHSSHTARKMARQINRMNEAATRFAADRGREATPAELADRLGISEDEVRRLMKTSLDAISVMELNGEL